MNRAAPRPTLRLLLPAMMLIAGAAPAADTPASLLAGYAADAGAAPSAERGRAFFQATPVGGKPDTPSCATCHTADPRAAGQTRAGKPIEPMAVSVNPKRLTDLAFVEKWLGRNCDSVLGRPCTSGEKADVVAYLAGL